MHVNSLGLEPKLELFNLWARAGSGSCPGLLMGIGPMPMSRLSCRTWLAYIFDGGKGVGQELGRTNCAFNDDSAVSKYA